MKRTLLFLSSLFFLSSFKTYSQNCTLRCPDNIVVPADPGKEGTIVKFDKVQFPDICGTITYTPASGGFFRLGNHSIIVQSSTGQRCSFTVVVTDNEPPVLSEIMLTRTQLWPASNKMKKVGLSYTVTDNGEDVKTQVTVSSNATDGIKDYEISDKKNIKLKASRLPDGSPRIYTITVTATDEAGNKSTRTTTIAVSNSMTPKPSK
jgi:hypothetical protein